MSDRPAHSPGPTIVEVWHAAGGIVALLDSGELVRLSLPGAMALAALPDDDELVGLTVEEALELAGAVGGAVG